MKLLGRFGHRRPPPLDPDTAAIRALAGLLAETGLSEIEYAIGDHRVRVARAASGKAAPAVNGHAPAPATTNGAAEHPPAEAPPPAAASGHPGTLTSPMVGIAYHAPEPGAAPFVRVGDQVGKGQPLLIIEAMKVMNQICAPHAGRITRVFVADAVPVEYGAPLMLIE